MTLSKTNASAYRQLIRKMKSDRYGKISNSHLLIAKSDPEFLQIYNRLFALLMTKNRALTVEVKELIVMGILAARGQYDALNTHMHRALKIGLTKEKIIETLEIAMMYSGTESMLRGGLELLETLHHSKEKL